MSKYDFAIIDGVGIFFIAFKLVFGLSCGSLTDMINCRNGEELEVIRFGFSVGTDVSKKKVPFCDCNYNGCYDDNYYCSCAVGLNGIAQPAMGSYIYLKCKVGVVLFSGHYFGYRW